MDPLQEQAKLELARITKIQRLWRSKRVFTNKQSGWKLSKSEFISKIVNFKLPTFFRLVFDTEPKGFTEIAGYASDFKKPVIRWLPGRGWVGDDTVTIKKVIAKRPEQSIVLSDDSFDVIGAANYEAALLAIVKSGWAPKILMRARPTYKKIDGIFHVNRDLELDNLAVQLKYKIPNEMLESVQYNDVGFGVPAVLLKMKKPKFTYQFFKNGTVLFTGIKKPEDLEVPKELFKQFFTKYDILPALVMNLAPGKQKITKPVRGGNRTAKMAYLANRRPLASSWNMRPPHGFYVRPGSNGQPRLYMWRKMEKEVQTGEWVDRGEVKLTKKDATEVAKAFAKVGKPVPAHTIEVFNDLGIPIEAPVASTKTKVKNRRAPNWNATRPGFYVRPGPGKQPYWFAVPAGIAAGRKTVIATYKNAGRNIPAAVRAIFKIPENVKTQSKLKHVITMGLNQEIRIDDRQASRLTKAELLAVARDMGIAQANNKMTPAKIVGLIQAAANVYKPVRNFNVFMNGMFYRLLNNGRVERTTRNGAIQTRRAWSTLPAVEQNALAKKILPANLHNEYNTFPKGNRYNALRAVVYNSRAKKVANKEAEKAKANNNRAKAKAAENAKALENNEAENLNLEFNLRLNRDLGNVVNSGNLREFMNNVYKKLPAGARGKPLKATVEAAYKRFVREKKSLRKNIPEKKRYTSRIQVPNYIPVNKANEYKKLVTNLAFGSSKFNKSTIKNAIKAWVRGTFPQSPERAAYNAENAITGEVVRIAAHVPPKRASPIVPNRSPKIKKVRKPKSPAKATAKVNLNKPHVIPLHENYENLGTAMNAAGLNLRRAYSWTDLKRAGINQKFKNTWIKSIS